MSFAYYLLQLPSFLMLVIIITVFTAFALGATYTFRRYIKISKRKMPTEIRGDLFGLLGGIYGLLLGFVVVLVWEAFNSAQTDAAKEQSAALVLYREIRYFPDTAKTAPLLKAYLAYVQDVITKEYPQMEQMKRLTMTNREHFNEVYRQLGLLNLADPRTERIAENLDELAMNRSLRQLDAYSDIPISIWVPLMLGYVILITCALFLNIESLRMHLLTNGLLGAFIGIIIYIIILVDHPFTGVLKVEPDQYSHILELQKNTHRSKL